MPTGKGKRLASLVVRRDRLREIDTPRTIVTRQGPEENTVTNSLMIPLLDWKWPLMKDSRDHTADVIKPRQYQIINEIEHDFFNGPPKP